MVFALIGLLVRGWKFALGSLVGLLLIISMQQWEAAMQTLALVLVATVIAVRHRDPARHLGGPQTRERVR